MKKNSLLRASFALTALLTACSVQSRSPADDHAAHATSGSASSGASDGSLPASNSAAAARLASSPRHAEWVKVAWEPGSRDSLMAWVVYPKTSNAKTPVVVVVHEIFGLSAWVRGVADQIAADGFIAVAPDLVSRARGGPSTVELTSDSARKLIQGVNYTERMKGITAVANYAMSQPSAAPRYGVIGYCWGGSTTFAAAVHNGRGFGGGVAFYGGFPYVADGKPIADSIAKIQKPIMLLNGSKDARIGAAMPALDSLMKSMRKTYEGHNYQGAIHGFLRAQDDSRAARTTATPPETEADVRAEQAANVAATRDGWPRTIVFLRKHLGS